MPAVGEEYVRLHRSYRVVGVGDGAVRMEDRSVKNHPVVEETLERFREEVEAGRAAHRPDCDHCGLPVDPADARSDGGSDALHPGCWFHRATVAERCDDDGGPVASEALRSGDPRGHLLDVIGDPARTFHDRIDAENLLSGAVPSGELLDAMFRCPNCGNGEQFRVDPDGTVSCGCGEAVA